MFVYALENCDNGKLYIGSSAQNINGRLSHHLKELRAGRHPNKEMQKEFTPQTPVRCYILEVACVDAKYLRQREQFWMWVFRTYDPEYGYNTHDILAVPPRLEDFILAYRGTPESYAKHVVSAERLGNLILMGREEL